MFKTFVDLFCGIGGFRLGLQACGLRCVWSCDIDKMARRVYNDNYHEMPAGDIYEVRAEDIPSMDVICGGFPCQSFSKAGKVEGFKDPRGQLIYEVLRIAEYHKPKLLLLENVPNLKNINSGRALTEICALFEKIGYNCQWFELNGAEYGVAQIRTRIYFVFIRNDIFEKVEISYNYLQEAMWQISSIADILDPVAEIPSECRVNQALFELFPTRIADGFKHIPILCGLKRLANDGKRKIAYETSNGARVYSDRGTNPTLTSRNNFVYDRRIGEVRKYSARELLKLQGFPEDFIIPSLASAIKLVGNSVIPRMVELVFRMIVVKK